MITEEEERRTKAAWERYQGDLHAVQTGVRLLMERRGHQDQMTQGETSPKHLRVGVNSAMVNDRAIVELLIQKGVITLCEYAEACAEAMRLEKESYTRMVRDALGTDSVTLI